MRENGFGGVEIAWIDPSWLEESERGAARPELLSRDWSNLVSFAKQEGEKVGLGCDFTFGSSWPFGGSWITAQDAAKTFTGLSSQRLGGSWETGSTNELFVLDHLSREAFEHYAEPLLDALQAALVGQPSALFCDSLEISTENLWSTRLGEEFASRFGYRLEEHLQELPTNLEVRYDYRRLIGDVIRREFYRPFTDMCHRHNAYSRVQCHGAPTDLLAAYAETDVPESESLLFLPPFSRIAASAAAWAGKNVVSAESFTCLHGFPGWDDTAEELWQEERAGDLKLLADALFANGVNHLVWHGMPYRSSGGEQEFYAAVHVGPDSSFAHSLPGLNEYFATACGALREGATYGSVGVYLPYEDALMLDRIADEERTPGANYHWEMRHARQPDELWGYAPVWVSLAFLAEARCEDGAIVSRSLRLDGLYVDVKWLDGEALLHLERLHSGGARIIWRGKPAQPGRNRSSAYERSLSRMMTDSAELTDLEPLLVCESHVPCWARLIDKEILIFFAHPEASRICYPMQYRQSEAASACQLAAEVCWHGQRIRRTLEFGANDGLLMRVSESGLLKRVPLAEARSFARD